MTAWPALEIELLWIVSLFNQDLANTCQIHQNTPITCHHKFQPDEHIWKSTLRCIASRHFPNVTFIRPCLDPSFLHFFTALLPSWSHRYQTPSLSPFWTDFVVFQIQLRQSGVLFHGLGQGLEGQETHDLRNTMKHKAHIIPQSCEKSPHIN